MIIHAGDIGETKRQVEFEPFPEDVPLAEPSPEVMPVQEPVPA